VIRTAEATGKTIDEAVNQALLQLGIERDLATVEVLEKPKSGFLGLGGSLAKVRVTCIELSVTDKAKNFVDGLLARMNAKASTEVDETEEGIRIRLVGEDLGLLIGHRGETLDAIQHITSFVVNKGEEKHSRIVVDTENYRAKREESLERLARKIAGKAVKYKRNMTLEPMNAYERHVIHTALQSWRDVSTYSTGTEPNRKVVVSYNPGKKNEAPGAQQQRPHREFRNKNTNSINE
jgi:spoIIIJ-associated protein